MDKELKILLNYELLAIRPYYEGKTKAILETVHGPLYSKEKMEEILQFYCYQFASSLQGRIQASREFHGNRKNPPILISELLEIVAMQLLVPYYLESMWLFDLNFDINEKDSKNSEVILQNGKKYIIPLSKGAANIRKFKARELLAKSIHVGKRKRFHKDDDT